MGKINWSPEVQSSLIFFPGDKSSSHWWLAVEMLFKEINAPLPLQYLGGFVKFYHASGWNPEITCLVLLHYSEEAVTQKL